MKEEKSGAWQKGYLKGIANTEMCTFLIVNISSLQLIPINIIAIGRSMGSTNPTRIVGAAILATTIIQTQLELFCMGDGKGEESMKKSYCFYPGSHLSALMFFHLARFTDDGKTECL